MGSYVVTAAAIVADDRYLFKDAMLPAGIRAETVAHLLDTGLVAELEDPGVLDGQPAAQGPGPLDEDPGDDLVDLTVDLDSMSIDDLREYAAVAGIDLGKASRKADIIAAIQTAE